MGHHLARIQLESGPIVWQQGMGGRTSPHTALLRKKSPHGTGFSSAWGLPKALSASPSLSVGGCLHCPKAAFKSARVRAGPVLAGSGVPGLGFGPWESSPIRVRVRVRGRVSIRVRVRVRPTPTPYPPHAPRCSSLVPDAAECKPTRPGRSYRMPPRRVAWGFQITRQMS